jgi:hypothetical protein
MSGVDDRPRLLVIRTERDEGDRVRLSVRDMGVGFEPQAMDRLFDAFYTTKSNGISRVTKAGYGQNRTMDRGPRLDFPSPAETAACSAAKKDPLVGKFNANFHAGAISGPNGSESSFFSRRARS